MNVEETNTSFSEDVNDAAETIGPPSNDATLFSFNNAGTHKLYTEYSNPSLEENDPAKFLDFHRMVFEQGNAAMTLKLSEYEKALADRDYTIQSLHTDLMNFRNSNHILNSQIFNVMEKITAVSNTCDRLGASFEGICERLNRFSDTVDNVKTRQNEVANMVKQTTLTFQQKIENISVSIDNSSEQANIDKKRARQELELLESKYSFELTTCKSDLEEYSNKIKTLKSENNLLLEKLNEANAKFKEQQETMLNFNQQFENKLKEMENQNTLLNNQNKSISGKYDEILIENQVLKDELSIIKISLDANNKQLNVQENIIKQQTELLDNLKLYEETNDMLKKDNLTLKECNENLEENIKELMDANNANLFQNKILEEQKNQLEYSCKNYEDTLKTQEEKLLEVTKELELQKEKENDIQNELVDLKHEVELSNKMVDDLQEEVKANYSLVPELQMKISELQTDLAKTDQILQDTTKEFMMKQNDLEKEKNNLENQSKEHFEQIEKLTASYMKYKTKAKKLYIEVMKLRYQYSRSEQKKSPNNGVLETIEILSDEEAISASPDEIIETYRDVSIMDTSIRSTSNRANQRINSSPAQKFISNLKRNSSLIYSGSKKRRPSIEMDTSKTNDEYNLNVEDKNEKLVSSSPLKNNKSILNASSNPAKKEFKIPADLRPIQRINKHASMPKKDRKPNSPVSITPVPSKYQN